MVRAHINRIGTALPPHDVHQAFIDFVGDLIEDRRDAALFRRMESRAGIAHRWSYVEPVAAPNRHVIDRQGFYRPGAFPSTAAAPRRAVRGRTSGARGTTRRSTCRVPPSLLQRVARGARRQAAGRPPPPSARE